jgi:hypothetical protein
VSRHTNPAHTEHPQPSPQAIFAPLSSLSALVLGLVALLLSATFATSTALAATQEDHTQFSVIAGSLSFSTVPAMPTLSSVTLNGQAQTTNSTMALVGM